MIEVDTDYSSQNIFACRVIGESMNRIIPNNSICLFKAYPEGTRNGKIVLVQDIDYQDPDFNSGFTVKTYTSEKVVTEDEWYHTAIVLSPNSYDRSFKPIVLDEYSAQSMRIIGEFMKVLDL